jgi:Protein of unknown function (DUF1549)/Protein of unknown function (DUF1553)
MLLHPLLLHGLTLFFISRALPPTPVASTLHLQIDKLLAAMPGPVAPPASDEEFVRRVTLDLTGVIPTAADARAFVADKAKDKRERLIDKLLASTAFARHMANVLDVILMERRPAKNVKQEDWWEYLRASVAANKPWDQFVRELLSGDGADLAQRVPERFMLDRDGEPHTLTRDVARIFLGMNLQCAQCHDHPQVEDYKQSDYHGLYAFFNRTSPFTEKNLVVLAEKADGEVTFQSVFDKTKTVKATGPHLPGGQTMADPKLEKGKEYKVAPAKNVRPIPMYSRRSKLAATLATGADKAFVRASVNRFWALLFGRGIVHPLDFDHPANPPANPELLQLLCNEFVAMRFDVRTMLRELTRTQVYQRSSVPPEGPASDSDNPFAYARLKALTPEQLAFSLMQATGHAQAEWLAQGKNATDKNVYAKLAGQAAPIVRAFAGGPGQPEGQSFQASPDQALLLRNGNTLRGWLAPRPGDLADRLAKCSDDRALADELFWSVLTRGPSTEERQSVAAHLQGRTKDRAIALQDFAWALLASAEFRFNH